jgi:hypothetical protein
MTDFPPVTVTPQSETNDQNWTPQVGQETLDFLRRSVPEVSREAIQASSTSILSKGVSPHDENAQETGLVVGYVQSGKTLSFETVAALAKDNSYQIIIVVAGIATNLLDQSTGRLAEDLAINDPTLPRRWLQLQNPSILSNSYQALDTLLENWRDPNTPPSLQRTALITVLKNHIHINNLTELLSGFDLNNAPVLIIDDEADQASLNNEAASANNGESTTYTRIMELRSTIPHHTYLQYTATPQAPLLINIIDALSPNFVEVLEPGPGYVGGRALFLDRPDLIKRIQQNDVPTSNNQILEPPESLIDALRVFAIGIAANIELDNLRGNRSMLVHPSHLTEHHRDYYNWVRDIFEEWRRCLDLAEGSMDRIDLIETFQDAYDDLRRTVGETLPTFERIASRLKYALRQIQVIEVNAVDGKTPPVPWATSFGWVLVGGSALNRGYTVEGLVVTYMPRGIGGGNADTVQQRARFFGYKSAYLDYCRVYLEDRTKAAFESYVDHEDDVRSQLIQVQQNDQPLNEWKRAFVLDSNLRACRESVLDLDYMRVKFRPPWIQPTVVYSTAEIAAANQNVVETFIATLPFAETAGHAERTAAQTHLVSENVSLAYVLDHLLVPYRLAGSQDSQRNTALLLLISRLLERSPDETCTVYQMSSGGSRQRRRRPDGSIPNLFQGAAPSTGSEVGSVYPGDRYIHEAGQISLQLHRLDLTNNDGDIVAEDVFLIAVHVPENIAKTYYAQEGV